MFAVTVQIITERGVQTSASGDPWWAYVFVGLLLAGWGYFATSMMYWRPRK